jgi:hypothetical protein
LRIEEGRIAPLLLFEDFDTSLQAWGTIWNFRAGLRHGVGGLAGM